MIERSLRASCAVGVVALCLSIGCSSAGPSAPAAPPPPEVAPPPSAEPAVASAAPSASAAPEVAPAAPAVPMKTCSKIAALAPTEGTAWRALVQPGACFTLKNMGQAGKAGPPGDVLVVESYDVRRVDDAEVARLRVTHATPTEQAAANGLADVPEQIAVTAKGAWVLDKKADDAAITKAMSKAPTWPAEPRPGEATKASKWSFAKHGHNAKGDVLCVGHDKPKAECTEACASLVCVSVASGVVMVEGASSPTGDTFLVDEALRPSFEPLASKMPAPKEPKPKKGAK